MKNKRIFIFTFVISLFFIGIFLINISYALTTQNLSQTQDPNQISQKLIDSLNKVVQLLVEFQKTSPQQTQEYSEALKNLINSLKESLQLLVEFQKIPPQKIQQSPQLKQNIQYIINQLQLILLVLQTQLQSSLQTNLPSNSAENLSQSISETFLEFSPQISPENSLNINEENVPQNPYEFLHESPFEDQLQSFIEPSIEPQTKEYEEDVFEKISLEKPYERSYEKSYEELYEELYEEPYEEPYKELSEEDYSLKEINCQNFWYFDNENKYCQKKQFCGFYAYQGLRTFKTKEECEANLITPTSTPSISNVKITDLNNNPLTDADGDGIKEWGPNKDNARKIIWSSSGVDYVAIYYCTSSGCYRLYASNTTDSRINYVNDKERSQYPGLLGKFKTSNGENSVIAYLNTWTPLGTKGTIKIRQINKDDNKLTSVQSDSLEQIEIDPCKLDSTNPNFTLTSSSTSQTGKPGDTLNYTLTIKNTDTNNGSVNCIGASFDFELSTTSSSLSLPTINQIGGVRPNSSQTVNFSITAPSNPGEYPFKVKVIKNKDRTYHKAEKSLDLKLIVLSPSPTSTSIPSPSPTSLISNIKIQNLTDSDGDKYIEWPKGYNTKVTWNTSSNDPNFFIKVVVCDQTDQKCWVACPKSGGVCGNKVSITSRNFTFWIDWAIGHTGYVDFRDINTGKSYGREYFKVVSPSISSNLNINNTLAAISQSLSILSQKINEIFGR